LVVEAETSLQRTKRQARLARGPYGLTGRAADWTDDRLGIARATRVLLNKIFPDHWSFLLGEIVLYSFVVLLATGVFLTLFYVPSSAQVIYHGSYTPLDGQRVSEAYQSTVNVSFDVRAGLLMRQMHHWSADIFIGSMVVHMGRVFLTGAFRKPRELNWYIGVTMLVLAVTNGFLGYSLPDDLISGTGLHIAYSIIESIPFVGSYLAFFTFGGNFPGGASLFARMYIVHVLVIPLLLLALVGLHLTVLVVNKHTQFGGRGRTARNVVGSPLWPNFTAKTTGFLLMISGALAVLAAFVQINPIWQFGSFDPLKVSYAVQPDWYLGWLDGALRIMPSWEWAGWGHTIPLEVFLPAVVFPGLVFTIALVWPAIEARITGDREVHHLLHRPSDRPRHTAFGAGFFALLAVLFLASSTDVLANVFHLSLNAVLWSMRILVLTVPFMVGTVTWPLCQDLRLLPGAGTRKRANVVLRSDAGRYVALPSALRADDAREELDPVAVPSYIDLEDPRPVLSSGVKTVKR
jgi:ubiquinol-cytochrome c reductase cytochrome b subunit